MKKRIKKTKLSLKLLSIIVVILLIVFISFLFIGKKNYLIENKVKDYSSYYGKYIVLKKDCNLYSKKDNDFIESGKTYKNTRFVLSDEYDKDSGYFKISGMGDNYYIKYDNFQKSDTYYSINNRYKNYIPYNKNIVTKENTNFYNDDGKLYTLSDSYNLPIILEDDKKYYVEFDNMLLYVLSDDVEKIIDNNNSSDKNTSSIAVLNYHFVYKPEEEKCEQEICHTEKQFRSHLDYIKNNGFFTPTMDELEKYIDGKLQLPKSVVITIDDGRNVNIATKILDEYKLNATAFIVTSRYDVEKDFIKSDYVELQSHSHALHDAGSCPVGHGQGGGLTCFDDDKILNDLKSSREELNGATAFCYPFYEYNEHSIELLKQAGFTMAFGGEYEGGAINAKVGINKFKIPRWVMVTYTTMDKFVSYLNGGK